MAGGAPGCLVPALVFFVAIDSQKNCPREHGHKHRLAERNIMTIRRRLVTTIAVVYVCCTHACECYCVHANSHSLAGVVLLSRGARGPTPQRQHSSYSLISVAVKLTTVPWLRRASAKKRVGGWAGEGWSRDVRTCYAVHASKYVHPRVIIERRS